MILRKRKLTARKAPFLSEQASHSLALPTTRLHYESLCPPETEKTMALNILRNTTTQAAKFHNFSKAI